MLWEKNHVEETQLFIDSNILKYVDILYIQNISTGSSFGISASTQNIINCVNNNCRVKIISNLFFQSYFLQLHSVCERARFKNDVSRWKINNPILRHIDRNILDYILSGKDDKEIVEIISDVSFYDEKTVHEEIQKELETFTAREEKCDIKMADYIKNYYDKRMMFVTNNHPTTFVMVEFARRLMKDLGIYSEEIILYNDSDIQAPCPRSYRFPIYPSVLKMFDFKEVVYEVIVEFIDEDIDILSGINSEIDNWIEQYLENSELKGERIVMKIKADFNTYMYLYTRYMRSILGIL